VRYVIALMFAVTASFAPAASRSPPKATDISAYRGLVEHDVRLATIGYRLTSANAPFCQAKKRNPGWVLHSYRQYPDRDVAKAAFPFPTPVAISAIVPGGPADQAGLKAGLGLYDLPGSIWWGGELAVHKPSYELIDTINRRINELLDTGKPLAVSFLSSGTAAEKNYQIDPPPICATEFWVDARGDTDAGADGDRVRITSGLIAFVADDDELAAVAAHELAHNLLGHPAMLATVRKKRTETIRNTESEADQLSVWLMANAGYDPRAAIRFWQRYGPTKAQGIFAARTHLPWRERISLMQTGIAAMEKIGAEKGLRAPPLLSTPKHQQ
jgi:beta-barrel assembly-enhancing protease